MMHRGSRAQVIGQANHPMASAMALGGLVSLVWVGVAGLLAWQTLSGGVADLLVSML